MRSDRFEFAGAQGQRLSGRLDVPQATGAGFRPVRALLHLHQEFARRSARLARAHRARLRRVALRLHRPGEAKATSPTARSAAACGICSPRRAPWGMPARRQLLIGHSLGGAAALAAAGELPEVKAIATIAAPFDVQQVTRLLGDGLQTLMSKAKPRSASAAGRSSAARFRRRTALARPAQRIEGLRCALLVLHSPQDTTSASTTLRRSQAASHPKSFVSLDNADHLVTRPRTPRTRPK